MQQRAPRSRFVRAAIVVVVLGAGGLLAAMLYGRSPANGEPAPARSDSVAREAVMTVTATALERVEWQSTIGMNGSVFAWQDVIIAPEVGGYRVSEVLVDIGDRVTRGQKLVELSTALLEAEVANKRATLSQREAELENAESALARGESLADGNLLSAADLDRLRMDALATRAGVAAARADLETSQLRLAFTNVKAPDDGIITSRTVTVGQIAQAGNEMLRLLRDGRIEWRGEVPEARLAELAPGQPVTLATADGTVFQGAIRVVSPTVSSDNRTGLVYVDLPSDERLRPGMFARGEIEIGRSRALAVPLESVVSSDGYHYVFVLHDRRTVERRRVVTGAVRDDRIEVISGLEEGELIVDQGAGFLRDGDLVNVAKVGAP